jgi:dipeptidase
LSPEYAPVDGQQEFVPIGQIPQVRETYAYWDFDYGVQNEMGLAIGESTCTAKTVGWPVTPGISYGYNRAGIEDLSKIALERCATARCAVKTMGPIAVEMGFYSADSGDPAAPSYSGSSEALVIADSEELWIFNVMTGKNNASAIWAAQKVPSDHVVAVGNSFTIRKMKLNDPEENFLHSPGVTDLAEEMGWWKATDDEVGTFDFFGAYGYTPANESLKNVLSYYSGRRMWRIFSLLSPTEGAKLDPNKGNLPLTPNPYPGSVQAPKHSVNASKLMSVLRDHYEGTPYDLTVGMAAGPFGTPNRGSVQLGYGSMGLWERAISMHRTSWSYISEAKPLGGGLTWLGYDSPHGTAYLPFYGGATSGAPESFHSHDGYQSKFSTKTAWWAFNLVNQYTDLNFQLINADVRKRAAGIEAEGLRLVSECEARARQKQLEVLPNGTLVEREVLTDCTNKFATEKVAEWWGYAWSLFAKYGRYAITHNETDNGMALQRYPGWWLTSPEVGFSTWSVNGPFHGILMASTPAELGTPHASQGHLSIATIGLLCVSSAILAGLVGHMIGTRRALRTKNRDDYMRLLA